MQKRFSKPVSFIGKSLFWSVLLYVACMLVINWDEMSANIHKQKGNIVQVQPSLPNKPEIVPVVSAPQINDDAKRSVISTSAGIVIREIAKAIFAIRK